MIVSQTNLSEASILSLKKEKRERESNHILGQEGPFFDCINRAVTSTVLDRIEELW
jgi:hypothetical protein